MYREYFSAISEERIDEYPEIIDQIYDEQSASKPVNSQGRGGMTLNLHRIKV